MNTFVDTETRVKEISKRRDEASFEEVWRVRTAKTRDSFKVHIQRGDAYISVWRNKWVKVARLPYARIGEYIPYRYSSIEENTFARVTDATLAEISAELTEQAYAILGITDDDR